VSESLASHLDFAVDAAWRAGKVTLEYFQTPVETDRKADQTPVTIADRRAEELLRDAISRRFPDYGILGEEFGELPSTGCRYRWVVDPIDGTASFIRGVPLYGVMVALEEDGVPVLGVVNLPALGELVAAARGEGCYWNSRRARVSTVSRLQEATVLTTDVDSMARYGRDRAWARVCAASRMQRTWGDCYGHVLVATGRAEVMLDPIMSPWDCAALLPILEEAGGTFTDWAGRRTHMAPEAVSTNSALFRELMEVLADTAPPISIS
jgi:histidinol phosphatase-like enzyme (inositol monophosphatase family)